MDVCCYLRQIKVFVLEFTIRNSSVYIILQTFTFFFLGSVSNSAKFPLKFARRLITTVE